MKKITERIQGGVIADLKKDLQSKDRKIADKAMEKHAMFSVSDSYTANQLQALIPALKVFNKNWGTKNPKLKETRLREMIREELQNIIESDREFEVINTGEKTINNKVKAKLQKLFKGAKVKKKHVPGVGYVLYFNKDGNSLGNVSIEDKGVVIRVKNLKESKLNEVNAGIPIGELHPIVRKKISAFIKKYRLTLKQMGVEEPIINSSTGLELLKKVKSNRQYYHIVYQILQTKIPKSESINEGKNPRNMSDTELRKIYYKYYVGPEANTPGMGNVFAQFLKNVVKELKRRGINLKNIKKESIQESPVKFESNTINKIERFIKGLKDDQGKSISVRLSKNSSGATIDLYGDFK